MRKLLLVLTAVVGLFLISGCIKTNSPYLKLKIVDQNLVAGETLSLNLSESVTKNGVDVVSFAKVSGVGSVEDGIYTFESTSTSEGPYQVTLKAQAAEGLNSSCEFYIYMCEFADDFNTGSLGNTEAWTTGGDSAPVEESSIKHSGENSVEFGPSFRDNSILETTVNLSEDAVLSFWLKTETDLVGSVNLDNECSSYNYMNFFVDDKRCGRWCGEYDWFEVVRELPAGEHNLKWEFKYSNNEDSHAQPVVWLDSVSIQKNRDLGEVVDFPDPNLRDHLFSCYLTKPATSNIYEIELRDFFEFRAGYEGIENLTGVEAMENLEALIISGNPMKNFESLPSLPKLKKLYAGYMEELEDISEISNLTNLEFLCITASSSITDFSPIGDLTSLTLLKLGRNETISDITFLHNLTNLSYLNLGYNEITDISILGNLTNLERLGLCSNNIEDISVLANLTNLEDLSLNFNSITDIRALSNLTSLEKLALGDNSITDISVLANHTNLEELALYKNSIDDVSILANLTNLELLSIHTNNISDISDLAGLTNLQTLVVSTNPITNIDALENLINLKFLNLSYTPITDIQALVNNQGFGTGDELILIDNENLDSTEALADIQTLRNRGVIVSYVINPSTSPARDFELIKEHKGRNKNNK